MADKEIKNSEKKSLDSTPLQDKRDKEEVKEKAVTAGSENAMSPKQALARQRGHQRRRPGRRKDRSRRHKGDDEYDSKIVSIRRVTRVYKGGKRMRLSVVVAVGDKKGHVGMGVGKGADVRSAEAKAIAYAKKHLVTIGMKNDTIPHHISHKKGAAKVFLKPAAPGTGIIAGASVRAVVELAGIKNILTKIIGTKNSINNAYATLEALSLLKTSRI